MIRLKAKQQEKKAENDAVTTTETAEEKPKTVKILGVGRGKRTGASKEKKRTPGEIRIQKGAVVHVFALYGTTGEREGDDELTVACVGVFV